MWRADIPHDTYDDDLREDLRDILKEICGDRPAPEPGTVLVRQDR